MNGTHWLYLPYFAGVLWFIICLNRTSRQSTALIDNIEFSMFIEGDLVGARRKLTIIENVSFNSHFFALLTFQNPADLYKGWDK